MYDQISYLPAKPGDVLIYSREYLHDSVLNLCGIVLLKSSSIRVVVQKTYIPN